MQAEEIESRIKAKIADAEITLTALSGDGEKYQVLVRSSEFSGKNMVAQHRAVYDAIGEDMGTTLHALSVKTEVK